PCGCKGLNTGDIFVSSLDEATQQTLHILRRFYVNRVPRHHALFIEKQVCAKRPQLRQSPLTARGSHPKSAYRQNPTDANDAAEFHTLPNTTNVGIPCQS